MKLVSTYLDRNFNSKRDYRIPIGDWYKSQYSQAVPFSDIKNSVDRSAIKDALRGEDRLDEINWYKYVVTQCPVNTLPPSHWEVVGAVNKNNVVDLMDSVKKDGIRSNQPISIMVKD